MQRPRPPFDRFRPPFRPFNAFPHRNRFEMPPHMHSFVGDARMMPPPFMPPSFPPNTFQPRRPFITDAPRPQSEFNMRLPREPRPHSSRFRPPSFMHRPPLLPQPQIQQTNPFNNNSIMRSSQDNHFQNPENYLNFSNEEYEFSSQNTNFENRSQEKNNTQTKRKYFSEDMQDQHYKRPRESFMKKSIGNHRNTNEHKNTQNNYNGDLKNNIYNENINKSLNTNFTESNINKSYSNTRKPISHTKNQVFYPNKKPNISNKPYTSSTKNITSNNKNIPSINKNIPSNTNNSEADETRIENEAKEWESLLETYKEDEVPDWVRCSPADLCFRRNSKTNQVESTKRMVALEERFETELLARAEAIRQTRPPVQMPERYYNKYQKKKKRSGNKAGKKEDDDDDEDDGDGGDDDDDDDDECDNKMSIIAWKNQHPELLHSEMWYNLYGEMNDGPLCRCSKATRKHGIRHNIYPGEENIGSCKPHSSNTDRLYHYKITMSPHTNFLTKNPTIVSHDDHEYIFEGFSLFSHYQIQKVPSCKVIRFNIEYTIHWFEEDMIENFDVRSLDLFSDYLYREVLELVDLDWIGKGGGGGKDGASDSGDGKENQESCQEKKDCGNISDQRKKDVESGKNDIEQEGEIIGDNKNRDENETKDKKEDEGSDEDGMGWKGGDGGSSNCRAFHIMPRFSRNLPDNGKEILSMNEVLNFMLKSNKPLMDPMQLGEMLSMNDNEWQDFVDQVRGMIVTYPGKRPSSLRIDQLDRTQDSETIVQYPKIIHFGYRPAQLSYVGDAVYSKLFKQYMKLKYLVANKPKLSPKDREKLRSLENQLQEIRLKGWLKREMTVEVSSEHFQRTGLKSDICQHALLLPVLLQHLRFHKCLDVLEESIGHQFNDRLYLQMAMTHPSFRMNYGTNPDHARNSLSNCGMRQLEYGDRHIHYIHTRKRGIKTLIHIMSKMARMKETASEIHHYERLEFLGDTVIEFLSSIHLFFLFPRLEEGGLATFRAALVQNQHLTVLAQKLGLQHYLLYAHGPDLCRDSDLRYALANCFEALMGSLYLDAGIEEADRVFGEALFKDNPKLHNVWSNLPCHRLQEDEPLGDRHWIEKSKPLQKLVKFEEVSGIQFNHIRLLARAFTMRNIGYNNLSLGHNQTLEFLGDTILQFITSEYLFKHFPDHHEGHLTLLRSSLVNNKTQAIICDDLGMTSYVINNDPKVKERMENEKNKVKDKADILEAFMGALYVDQGLDPCIVFCQVCFYPRLKEFIMNQDWNDAKSQLQQCCLTLRDPTEGEPDIPIYKVLQCTGPTNTRKYHVAVYFKGQRLATGVGHSIQQGEMEAATNALKENSDMFPHLLQTKQYLDWRFNKYFNSHVENKASLQKAIPPSRFKIDRRNSNKFEDNKKIVKKSI